MLDFEFLIQCFQSRGLEGRKLRPSQRDREGRRRRLDYAESSRIPLRFTKARLRSAPQGWAHSPRAN